MNVTAVRLEGFDIEVREGAPEARAVADFHLGGAWRVEAGVLNPRQFDLLAPEGTTLDIGRAWELSRKMIEDGRVTRAEPVIVIEGDAYWNWAASRRFIESEIAKGVEVVAVARGGPIDGASLRDAVRQAVAKGIMVAAVLHDRWPFPVYPAKYPEVVAVASEERTNEELERWHAQHRGTDVVAVHKSRFADLAEYFPDTPPEQLYKALVQLLNTTDAQLESDLEQFGRELQVHIALDTDVRATLAGTAEPGVMLPVSRSLRAKMQPPLQQ